MKNKLLMFFFLFGIQFMLVNCAKNNSNSNPSNGICQAGSTYYNGQCVQGYGQMCQAGYVSTQQYGCLAQNGCPVNSGYLNGQCIPGTVGGYGQTCQAGTVGTTVGCLPQGSCPANMGYYSGTSYNGQYSQTGFCFQRTY
jgi:hypothetical protein